MDVVDNGKPIWEARMDLESVIDSLQYYGGMGKEYNLHTGPLGHSFTTELFDHLFMSVSSLEVTTRVHLICFIRDIVNFWLGTVPYIYLAKCP